MLDCKRDRLDYGQLLIPPSGYRFENAIAASYSADLGTLLSIPVALVYAQTLEGDLSGEKLQLLEAIKQFSQRVRVYHQAGQIHVPSKLNGLYAHLEDALTPILPDTAFSAFHPKVWVIRFTHEGDDESHASPVKYRVIVLSRNLTYDRSWDVAASLDGEVGSDTQAKNRPLIDFVEWLDQKDPTPWAGQFIEELAKTAFETPDGFDEHFFHPTGITGHRKSPIEAHDSLRALVLSPFLDAKTVEMLRAHTKKGRSVYLFSEPHEFAKVPKSLLKRIYCHSLSSVIIDSELSENNDTDMEAPCSQKLHAKTFIFKTAVNETRWFLGSANATQAAMHKNVEFMVELRSALPRARIAQTRKELTGGSEGNGPFIYFDPDSIEETAPQQSNEQIAARQFEHALMSSKIEASVCAAVNGLHWDLSLSFDLRQLTPQSGLKLSVRPFNIKSPPPAQVLSAGQTTNCSFKNISELELSRFLQFRIEGSDGHAHHEFLYRIEIDNLPEGRLENIFRKIVNCQDRFFEYLRLLLAEDITKEDLLSDGDAQTPQGHDDDNAEQWLMDLPIYEQLLLIASRNPRKLIEVDKVIQDLTPKADEAHEAGATASIIPDDFMSFWDVFRNMIPASKSPKS